MVATPALQSRYSDQVMDRRRLALGLALRPALSDVGMQPLQEDMDRQEVLPVMGILIWYGLPALLVFGLLALIVWYCKE